MALITKSRHLICPSGPIDPYEPFQPEITVTLVTLEAKNIPLNPPQKWGFQAKKDPLNSSDYFGPNEHLPWPPSPNLDIKHVPWVPRIHMNHSNQKLQPLGRHWRPRTCPKRTCRPTPHPSQTWGFQAKKDPLQRLFWTH